VGRLVDNGSHSGSRFALLLALATINPMDWIEITVTADGEGAEAVADALSRYVHQGVAIENRFPHDVWEDEPRPAHDLIVRAYIPADEEADDKKQKIRESLYYLSRIYPKIPEPEFGIVHEEDWAEAWKKHFHPIRIGKHILIKPAWIDVEPDPDDIVIELDPGMAFGTGTHPTTQLCLQACEWFVHPDTNMLDIGTGSGILAIAAAKLGANKVLGRDIDPIAVKMAQENIERNGVQDIVTIQQGSLEGLLTSPRRWGLGMANITANVIEMMAGEGLQHLIWPGSMFIFSGVIESQVDDVVAVLDAVDLKLLGKRQQGDWVMLITQRRWD
jgi:ribosomal protein L11 methyltransferase